MGIQAANFVLFLAVSLSFGITRLIFRKHLPIRLVSTATAACFGFIVFLALPILVYPDYLGVSVYEYCCLVWVAFSSFLLGASLARRYFRPQFRILELVIEKTRLATVSGIYCIGWASFSLLKFIFSGGLQKTWLVVFGGFAHNELVSQLGEVAVFGTIGTDFKGLLNAASTGVFISFWVVFFRRYPKTALVVYFANIIPSLGTYFSRTGLLGEAIVPYLAYLVFVHPSRRKMTIQAISIVTIVIVFFSWNSAARLGAIYEFSTGKVIDDVFRDAGGSIIPASLILAENYRGNSREYMTSYFTFLIPRAIWKTKPYAEFNFLISNWYSGKVVGYGTSVVTSTMLGEGWYYFGWSGAFWLFMVFGILSQVIEIVLSKNILLFGMLLNIVYLTFVQIRSTFLSYYQECVFSVLLGIVLVSILNILSHKRPIRRLVS